MRVPSFTPKSFPPCELSECSDALPLSSVPPPPHPAGHSAAGQYLSPPQREGGVHLHSKRVLSKGKGAPQHQLPWLQQC